MTLISATFPRDANQVPIRNTQDIFITKITRAYAGTAGLGAVGTTNIFTVTGIVCARIIGLCTEDLASAGGGAISIGVVSTAGAAASTNGLIVATTATNIDVGEVWVDATPVNGALLSSTPRFIDTGSITEVVATGDVTDGTIDIYCLWSPFTRTGNVVAV